MKQEELQLTGGGKKENRRELDFYPTPRECTVALMDFLQLPKCFIWEPACGDGSMSEVLHGYGHLVYSSDISPNSYGDSGCDYLTAKPFNDYDAIITNPPFNLSQEFIEKAVTEAPLVAMLLKSQYWHAKTRLDLFKKNPPAYVLPLTWRPDFLAHLRKPGEKGNPTMEVAWTIWKHGDTTTKYVPLGKPIRA